MFPIPAAPRDRGASSVEYGLLVMLIAAVIVLAVVAFGTLTGTLFTDTCEEYPNSAAQTECT
jgi:Flp pilus assembly pilin Flp